MISQAKSDTAGGAELSHRRSPQRRGSLFGSPASGRHWLIVGESRGGEVFSLLGKLAVFSYREEAEAFLANRVSANGWHVRRFWAGELVSLLYASWSGFEYVVLDPPPESDGSLDGLLSVSCREFVEMLAVSYTHLTLPTNREV